MNTVTYTGHKLYKSLLSLLEKIKQHMENADRVYTDVYGVSRGGFTVAAFISHALAIPIITKFEDSSSTLVVDDVVESGRTRRKYFLNDFACLDFKYHGDEELKKSIIYVNEYTDNIWIMYPWEEKKTEGIDFITRLIEYIGENPLREGLKETPIRVIKSYKELYKGYGQDPKEIFTTFQSGTYDQLILLKDIEMYSTCEHHLLPFIGKAHIAYIPKDRVVGISKLARLLEIYSRRLQIQERIGEQVTAAIMEHLKPLGAACIIQASHLCMRMRGINKQNSTMVTSSLKGVFLEDPQAKEELFKTIRLRD